MDFLAENRFTLKKSLFMEGMLRISREGYGKAAAKGMALVLGLWVLFFIYTLMADGSLPLCLGFLLVLGAAGLWLCLGIPRRKARSAWKALENAYGSAPGRTARFYPDHLVVLGEGLERQIPYDSIARILTSRRLLILVCRDRTGILLGRKDFTKENETYVTALIRSHQDKE